MVGAVTVVPWAAVLLAGRAGIDVNDIVVLAALGSVAHVGTTVAFYTDRELRPVLREDPRRYLLAPVLAVAAGVLFMTFAPSRIATLGVAGFLCWQIHHFTRQNLGCFAFCCRALQDNSPSADERRIFDLTGWAGMCGVVVTVHDYRDTMPMDLFMVAGIGFLALAVWRAVQVRPAGWRAGALAMAIAFYAPLLLMRASLGIAATAYGFAHALQYYVMMGHLAGGRTVRGRWGMTAAVVGGFVIVGLPLYWLATRLEIGGATPWAAGLYFGLVACHFIIDAGVWKMRDPEKREYMKRRFAFL